MALNSVVKSSPLTADRPAMLRLERLGCTALLAVSAAAALGTGLAVGEARAPEPGDRGVFRAPLQHR